MLHTIFFVCFGIGVGYAVISFLLGQLFDFMDIGAGGDAGSLDGLDGGLDGGVDGGADVSADGFDGGSISPLKPIVIASFVTVFGGSGLILLKSNFSGYIALTLALTFAVVVAYLLYRYVVIPLNRAQNTSAIEQHKLIGHSAKVTLKIPQGQYGKIKYIVSDTIYSSPAKSLDGSEIGNNENVEIVCIEKNTFFVKKINKEDVLCLQKQ